MGEIAMRKYELFSIEGCVSPRRIGGQYPSRAAVLAVARREREKRGDADVLLVGWITDAGRMALVSFSTRELEPGDKPSK